MADNIFAKLRRAVPKPYERMVRHNLWISEKIWRLVDKIVYTRKEPGQYQTRFIWLGWEIRATLKEDR